MEIKFDFKDLWAQVRRVSSQTSDFDWAAATILDPVDIALSHGRDIKLEDLDYVNGLLSVDGRQVLLYIPDQFRTVEEVQADPSLGKRFHVADCKALADMRAKGRFERYVVTNNLSGLFEITGKSYTSHSEKPKASLLVCRYCLGKLNYRDYSHAAQNRHGIWNGFSISEFFETYSTTFKFLPRRLAESAGPAHYTSDWRDISAALRERCGYICDQCRVNLSAHRHLLHVHHINGVKSDNVAVNLRSLCIDCHRKQPLHERMLISSENMRLLSTLRRSQQVYPVTHEWDEALALADLSVHGALLHARHKGLPVPQIGYEFVDAAGVYRSQVEVAWPQRRIGIHVMEKPIFGGWQLFNPVEFIETY